MKRYPLLKTFGRYTMFIPPEEQEFQAAKGAWQEKLPLLSAANEANANWRKWLDITEWTDPVI